MQQIWYNGDEQQNRVVKKADGVLSEDERLEISADGCVTVTPLTFENNSYSWQMGPEGKKKEKKSRIISTVSTVYELPLHLKTHDFSAACRFRLQIERQRRPSYSRLWRTRRVGRRRARSVISGTRWCGR